MLDTGWYRLVRGGGSRQAMAVFRVVAVDEPLEPVLAVPWEDSYLSLDVAAIGPAGGLLDMVPAEGSEVTRRPHGEDIERAAQLSRWEQGEWTSSRGAALDLDPDEPVGNTRAVRVSIPQLDPGFWRVQVEAADGGELTGYFWVVDQLAGEGNTGSASAGAGESFHPLATEARPVDAATASAQCRRFDEVHGDSYAATIDVRSSSGEPSPPYRIEIRDEMISRVTLPLEDGTEEDISDQLARHNVVSVGWIMDQIEGAAARSDATFTAVYDEQGVPRFVRFEDGTSPDLSAVEYLVTDVIRLPD